MKKITIVTVCYNAASCIENTILSVIRQDYPVKEYLVIDGASKDDTLSIVKKYEKDIDRIKSEPDKGIYDAMNKAIALATGDYILFMNAGDSFANTNTLSTVFGTTSSVDEDIVYGDAIYRYSNGSRTVKATAYDIMKWRLPFSHQSVFVKTSLMKTCPFALQYKLAADYDFFLKTYLKGASHRYVNIVVGDVRIDDGNSYKYFYRSKKEVRISQKKQGYSPIDYWSNYLKATGWFTIKRLIKKVISPQVYNKILTSRIYSKHSI